MVTRRTGSLYSRIGRSLKWNAAGLFVTKGFGFVVQIFLAKLLVPEHFGLVGMIILFLGLADIFVDFGLQSALVQRLRDRRTRSRYDSAFWFLIGSGLFWTVVMIILGIPFIVWLYHEPKLELLGQVMSIRIFLNSLSIIPIARLTRRMRFKYIVISDFVATVVSSTAAIVIAWLGGAVWCLVVQQILLSGTRTLMLNVNCSWRPRWRFQLCDLRDLMHFSSNMLAVRLIDYCRSNLDRLLIGTLLGPAALGIYHISFMITETARQQLSSIISSVLLPAFSQIKLNEVELKRQYLFSVRNISLLIFPIMGFVITYASLIVSEFFPPEWSQAATIIQILAISGSVYALSGPTPELLQAVGQPNMVFRTSLWNLMIVTIPSLWIFTLTYDLIGTSAAVVLSMMTLRLSYYIRANRILKIPCQDFMSSLLPALITVLFSLVLIFALNLQNSIAFGSAIFTFNTTLAWWISRPKL